MFFPALENAGFHYLGADSLAMLLGHCIGRSYMRQIAETLKNIRNGEKQDCGRFMRDSREYLAFLRRRITQYHSYYIPLADGMFSRDTLRKISIDLEDIDRRVLENAGNVPFKWMAAELARVYLPNGTAKTETKRSLLPEEEDRESVVSAYTFSPLLNSAGTKG